MNYYPKKSNQFPVSIQPYIELAKIARAEKEEWVQQALYAVAVTNDSSLAEAIGMKLKLRAVIEELDPFPFGSPQEDEFLK